MRAQIENRLLRVEERMTLPSRVDVVFVAHPLLDVIERLHQDCYWRGRCGSCKNCEGTPVADT